MSNERERSSRPSDSTTIGTSWLNALLTGCAFYTQPQSCVSSERRAVQIEREIVFPASPAEVWEALTEPERLEEWFATEVELDAQPGGEGVVRWGDGD